MKRLWRVLKRCVLALVIVAVLLAAPVLWVETSCHGDPSDSDYAAILPQAHHRAEARTFMTYPEWHIVHAYDDYGQVISRNDPHDFGFLRAITGYWSSLCALTRTAAAHGGVDGPTKQLVYVIGVSFTAELALKAAYEETLGRFATVIRGSNRATLDDLSAQQARDYATFLQQVPWYKWDFDADSAALADAAGTGLRDRERAVALGLEYGAKARYAKVIAAAVESTGQDALSLRMIVTGLTADSLAAFDGVTVIDQRPRGIEIETPRYRRLTGLLQDMADAGAEFVEIAGNDDILLTALSGAPTDPAALYSFRRQGYDDYRHLMALKVGDLAAALRAMGTEGPVLEHIHDY